MATIKAPGQFSVNSAKAARETFRDIVRNYGQSGSKYLLAITIKFGKPIKKGPASGPLIIDGIDPPESRQVQWKREPSREVSLVGSETKAPVKELRQGDAYPVHTFESREIPTSEKYAVASSTASVKGVRLIERPSDYRIENCQSFASEHGERQISSKESETMSTVRSVPSIEMESETDNEVENEVESTEGRLSKDEFVPGGSTSLEPNGKSGCTNLTIQAGLPKN